MDEAKKQRRIFIAAINAASLLALAVLTAVLLHLSSILPSQNTVSRWNGSGERFSQISVFYSDAELTDLNRIYTMRVDIDKKLAENSISPANNNARSWIDAFSAETKLTVSSVRSDHTFTSEARCIATGGDYFIFHPLKLLSGSYYSDSDLMQDRVVIDNNLAWQLFGSYDVAGMNILINGEYFYIAGVILPDSDKATEYVTGTAPAIYISYTALEKLSGGTASAINCYEVCLPDPVTGLAEKITRDVSHADDKHIRIINNSERFSLLNLWKIVSEGEKRVVSDYPMVYPFWENAARITEEKAADILAAMIFTLIIPVLTVIMLIRRLIVNRRLILHSAAEKLIAALHNIANILRRKRRNI